MVNVFTSDELYDFLYEGDYEKFKSNMDDLKSRLKYFDFSRGYWADDLFVVKFINEKIVGILDYVICKNDPTFQGHLHFISYVSVDPGFQNRGIAKELIDHFSKNVVRSDKGVLGCSGFTHEGFVFLRPKLLELDLGIEMEDKISF